MIIKLRISSDQLAALHKVLDDKGNFWEHKYETILGDDGLGGITREHTTKNAIVFIKSCRGQGSSSGPAPLYDVTLEVPETFGLRGKERPTPLARLTAVFEAVGLFPNC